MDIPRKLHADDDHPFGPRAQVFVDDAEQTGVIEYDIDEGFVRVLKVDDNGNPFAVGDEFASRIVRGVVTVKDRFAC